MRAENERKVLTVRTFQQMWLKECGSVWMSKLRIRTQKTHEKQCNEYRNWKASTLKTFTFCWPQTVLLFQRLWFGPFQFQMCLIRKERDMQPYFVHWTNGCLSKEIRRVSTFVSIRNPFTLLKDLNQYIDNKWLLNSLHHLKISRILYNDITKKTCMIPDARSKPLHFPA